jgi:hypothetical protein
MNVIQLFFWESFIPKWILKEKDYVVSDLWCLHVQYWGCAIAQAVSRWLPTAAAQFQAQVSSCGICGGQSGTGAGFLRVLLFPLPILIPLTAPHSSSSIIRGWYNRTISGRRTKWTQSHPTARNWKIMCNAAISFQLQVSIAAWTMWDLKSTWQAVTIDITVVLDVTPCSLVHRYECLGGTCCLNIHIVVITVSYDVTPCSLVHRYECLGGTCCLNIQIVVITVSCDVSPCSLVHRYECLGGTCCLNIQIVVITVPCDVSPCSLVHRYECLGGTCCLNIQIVVITVSCDVSPCSLVHRYECLGETCCLNIQIVVITVPCDVSPCSLVHRYECLGETCCLNIQIVVIIVSCVVPLCSMSWIYSACLFLPASLTF